MQAFSSFILSLKATPKENAQVVSRLKEKPGTRASLEVSGTGQEVTDVPLTHVEEFVI